MSIRVIDTQTGQTTQCKDMTDAALAIAQVDAQRDPNTPWTRIARVQAAKARMTAQAD